MLIVFTREDFFSKEADLINRLFELGLERLHLRKPLSSVIKCKALLQQIDSKFHCRIMLHQHHKLVETFSCCGVHLKESQRRKLSSGLGAYLNDFQAKGYMVSSSFHSLDEVLKYAALFNYVFLSPVFDSISKPNYLGKKIPVAHLNAKNIVALGGIHKKNIAQLNALGYTGAALLGSIWNSNDPAHMFKKIHTTYSN